MLRRIKEGDRATYLTLAHDFYHSPAVLHPVPYSYMERTFDEMMSASPYVLGFMIEDGGACVGYTLLAKTYSQEAGGMVLWIEEIYLVPEARGRGIGKRVFAELEDIAHTIDAARIRLEVEPDNTRAKALYTALGYEELPYRQMKKGE